MLVLFKGGQAYVNDRFETCDILIGGGKIIKVGKISEYALSHTHLEVEVINCNKLLLLPGLIDSQAHMAGGSGEAGFLSQPPRVLIEECIRGGITSIVGCIGVDTYTKTMSNLFASVRAFKEAGLNAYAYSGGYEIPPKTLTQNLSTDILYVEEIIGAGEVAIADHRAPEPTADQLARVVVDSYVAGTLTKKCGVTRIHVGPGERKLQTVREMTERHEIKFDSLYFTHMDRSRSLVVEGVEIAKKGSFVDFDIHENDLQTWYKFYLAEGGPPEQMSFSTDAGVASPVELWREISKCCLEHECSLERLLQHVTTVPAKVLKLNSKGSLLEGCDADIIAVDEKHLDIRHVFANGKFFLKEDRFQFIDQPFTLRRKSDWYGLRTQTTLN